MDIFNSPKLSEAFKAGEAKFDYNKETFKEFCQKILEREGIATLQPETQIEFLIKEISDGTKKSINAICVPRDTFDKIQRHAHRLFPTAID
jgi:hypothetical protein